MCVTNDVVMSVFLMYERAEDGIMTRRPRNPLTERLANYKFFIAVYLYYGIMLWLSAMVC